MHDRAGMRKNSLNPSFLPIKQTRGDKRGTSASVHCATNLLAGAEQAIPCSHIDSPVDESDGIDDAFAHIVDGQGFMEVGSTGEHHDFAVFSGDKYFSVTVHGCTQISAGVVETFPYEQRLAFINVEGT